MAASDTLQADRQMQTGGELPDVELFGIHCCHMLSNTKYKNGKSEIVVYCKLMLCSAVWINTEE